MPYQNKELLPVLNAATQQVVDALDLYQLPRDFSKLTPDNSTILACPEVIEARKYISIEQLLDLINTRTGGKDINNAYGKDTNHA